MITHKWQIKVAYCSVPEDRATDKGKVNQGWLTNQSMQNELRLSLEIYILFTFSLNLILTEAGFAEILSKQYQQNSVHIHLYFRNGYREGFLP